MKLFVYGTLRKNEILSDAIACKDIYSIGGLYPGVIGVGEGDRVMYGEVLDVSHAELSEYDYYEGNSYTRKSIKTLSGKECFVYEYNGSMTNISQWPFSYWPIEGAKQVSNR